MNGAFLFLAAPLAARFSSLKYFYITMMVYRKNKVFVL